MNKEALEKIIETDIKILETMVLNKSTKRDIDKELIDIGKNILLYSRLYNDQERLLQFRDRMYAIMGIGKDHRTMHGY